jgi:hypothetical protein
MQKVFRPFRHNQPMATWPRNKKIAQQLRTLQPAATAAANFAAVSKVISDLIEILPTQTKPSDPAPGPLGHPSEHAHRAGIGKTNSIARPAAPSSSPPRS